MKTICMLLILLLIHPFSLPAGNPGVGFSLKAGVNYSTINTRYKKPFTPGPEEYHWLMGFYIGGVATLSLSESLSFSPELTFSQQGAAWRMKLTEFIIDDPDDPLLSQDLHGKIKESVILIPALFKLSMGKRFSVEAGPQFGLLVNQKFTGFLSTIEQNKTPDKFRISACLGMGYTFGDNIRLGLRYSFGLKTRAMVLNEYYSLLQLGLEYGIPFRHALIKEN